MLSLTKIHFFPAFAKLMHGLDGVSKGRMLKCMQNNWFTTQWQQVFAADV